jgi:hypothetical protein
MKTKMGRQTFDISPSTLLDRHTKRPRVETEVMLHTQSSKRELSSDQPLSPLSM